MLAITSETQTGRIPNRSRDCGRFGAILRTKITYSETPMSPPPPVTTTLLLERLRAPGDELAWSQFDLRFRGVLMATGLRLGLAQLDAEEAAQETMLQAFRDFRAGKYDRSRGRLSSWILGIAHHRITDIQRRRGAHTRFSEQDSSSSHIQVDRLADAFEAELERQIFQEGWRIVCEEGDIAPRTLLAFELTALRGVPPAAAAAECGISVDQVYVAKHRVAQRLQAAIELIDCSYRDGL